MATVAGIEWSRGSSLPSHPDTSSPVFPERPIRPLPKRRLRSRLSEEEANSIGRPIDPSSSPSVFGSPSAQRDVYVRPNHFGETHIPQAAGFHYPSAPGAYESDEDREEESFAGHRSSWSNDIMRYPRGSTASSVDGESFENTNNKKKRKIPLQHNSNFPVDANDSDPGYGGPPQVDGSNHSHNTGRVASSSTRSRSGRNIPKGKQPLGTSLSGINNNEGLEGDAAGIKSSRSSASRGQENNRASLSQQQQQAGQQMNEFTFNYPSDSSRQLNQASRAGIGQSPLPPTSTMRNATTHGTQTGHSGATSGAQRSHPGSLPQTQATQQGATQPENNVDPPTQAELRRQQALARKREQRMINKRKGLRRSEVTLCQFCLYDAIYGEKPRSLIREYEQKELKRRQEQENRRRLLEKAKAKSRKTRKAGRGGQVAKNPATHATQTTDQTQYDPQYDALGNDPQSPEDEFYEDDFDEPGNADDFQDGYDEYGPPLDSVNNPSHNTFSDPTSPSSPPH